MTVRTLFLAWALGFAAGAAAEAAEVAVVANIAYLPAGREEKLDLYLPPRLGRGQTSPAVVWLHGGGWFSGDKAQAREKNIGQTLDSPPR